MYYRRPTFYIIFHKQLEMRCHESPLEDAEREQVTVSVGLVS